MADQDKQHRAGKTTPHYDPTDETGNGKEVARPTVDIAPEDGKDPERRKRADEVLGNFEGEAVRQQPDGF
jgi:hypothetical protein